MLLAVSLGVLLAMVSCTPKVSEGTKYGLLQKVSHRESPCDMYVAEVAYEGSRIKGNSRGDGKTDYEATNSQEFEITQAAYDSLQTHVGDKIVFHYKNHTTNEWCSLDIFIDKITIKP